MVVWVFSREFAVNSLYWEMVKLKDSLAPVVLFVYNRPEHTRKTVEALLANRLAPQSRLFVFSDGAKNDLARPAVEAVRRYVDSIEGFASIEVIKRFENQGLAASVISGVTQVVEEYGEVIVLEDDMVTVPHFLDHMNEGLDLYRDDADVATIQGHIYPLGLPSLPQSYFLPSLGCWGWGTWSRAWRDFEPDGSRLLARIRSENSSFKFDLGGHYPYTRLLKQQALGKVDSWAIRWYATNFLLDRKGLYPSKSLLENIGFDGTGVHCSAPDSRGALFNGELAGAHEPLKKVRVQVDGEILRAVGRALNRMLPPPLWVRALRKLCRLLMGAEGAK